MRVDVEDVARNVASRRTRHEWLAPEAELRLGLAVLSAVGEHERHPLVERAPSRIDDLLGPAAKRQLRHDVIAPVRAFAFVQDELDARDLRILHGWSEQAVE